MKRNRALTVVSVLLLLNGVVALHGGCLGRVQRAQEVAAASAEAWREVARSWRVRGPAGVLARARALPVKVVAESERNGGYNGFADALQGKASQRLARIFQKMTERYCNIASSIFYRLVEK